MFFPYRINDRIMSVKEVPAPKNKAKAVRIKSLSRCKSSDDNMFKLNIEIKLHDYSLYSCPE
ncbi:hypothetical protein OZ668_05325 [Elizabethkingia sp. HX XZB]|uniref:hypothetical protein n=1 Tax=Elizabethkingia sp. HX XZB TaxID=3003193 RepID=UPI002A24EFDD|nr:hypothetical protein [Elizabethkingia sp. HX XZB]MDX8567393.1 hypothetical protein [Elizabethkingia sp. HX XZB]